MARALPLETRRQILQLIDQGVDSVTIAQKLGVKAGTVRQIRKRTRAHPFRLENRVDRLAAEVQELRRAILAIQQSQLTLAPPKQQKLPIANPVASRDLELERIRRLLAEGRDRTARGAVANAGVELDRSDIDEPTGPSSGNSQPVSPAVNEWPGNPK